MNLQRAIWKNFPASILAFLILIAATSCSSFLPQSTVSPVIQTQIISLQVTREVTLEVTQVVEVPVTVTPTTTLEFTLTPSITPTITRTPAITASLEKPRAVILQYVDCLYGPADFYLYKTSWLAGSQVEVVGRDKDSRWINVQVVDGWNSCWIPVDAADLGGFSVSELPVVTTILPLSRYEYGPPAGYAWRENDEVTVFWKAVWISRDEVRGYLMDASTCQGGNIIQEFIFIPVTFDENVGTLSYKFRDDAGCDQASGVRIASVGKRGYTLFERVIWPPR